ncbi:hypothetical protein AC579_2590 [Pseudocercospora musae]|uniref:Uncharacterized protein n=1 Tax=Pseudocercospora musae TaxID=113226 RepID=A0A139IF76_9PEZI|nr:hypothetical protein AC579_2590 [Pseudocercospora musae]
MAMVGGVRELQALSARADEEGKKKKRKKNLRRNRGLLPSAVGPSSHEIKTAQLSLHNSLLSFFGYTLAVLAGSPMNDLCSPSDALHIATGGVHLPGDAAAIGVAGCAQRSPPSIFFIILLACGWQMEKRIGRRRGVPLCDFERVSNDEHGQHAPSSLPVSQHLHLEAPTLPSHFLRHQHRSAYLLLTICHRKRPQLRAHHRHHQPYQGPDDTTFPGRRMFLESRLIINVARYQTPENYKIYYYGGWNGKWQQMWMKEARESVERVLGGDSTGKAPTSGGFL